MSAEVIYSTTLQRISEDELCAKLAESPEQAARWVYAAAVSGYIKAQIAWAQMLLDGTGTRRDHAAAFRWFNIASLSNDTDAINMVGRCYELGWGVATDPAEAARWFRKAADTGHAWAQFNLATLMLRGDGVPADLRGAVSLLVRSARQGNAKSMNMLGRCREEGWVGRVDRASATRWYRRAAVGGCFRGAFHLGRFLAAAGDATGARRWFQSSVDGAPADFCHDAAELLLSSADPALQTIGRSALARAAESDDPAALFAYGHALAIGRGGPIALAESRIWLGRASARGHIGATALLNELLLHRMP